MAQCPGLDRLARGKRGHDVDPLRPVRFKLAIGIDDLLQEACERIAGLAGPERSQVAALVCGDGLRARGLCVQPIRTGWGDCRTLAAKAQTPVVRKPL